ncbi:WavE lipopolysaccharide synthesis family protein [Legionella fairfieldensis]|uniref:WavE lipopolysaccharide synthesis family protein n=1 Tax=Legionella fairfieldensis TaxID=45064 RepID=UPI00048A8610|nr:WavE lipopolysaccharide synthesis family protein [Legionella fairfieldensis]
MIQEKDISIVVQGPIIHQSAFGITNKTTQLVCQRLKDLFPSSELILSTWEGENVNGIIYDKIIFNKDPGATWFNYENYDLLNNCNRLILSTFSGIKAASRKYVLKLRSDLFIISKKFLNYFDKFNLYNTEYKFVKNRIICFSLNTLYGHKTCLFTMYRPFHISDWAYFGFKEDLLNLYDIPLIKEPEFSQWFLTRCKPFYDIEPWRLWKMPPEQYITYSFLNKFFSISLEHTADTSHDNIVLSTQLITNNFLILDQTQFSLISLKYLYFPFSSEKGYEWYIFHSDWLRDYCNLMEMTVVKKLDYKIRSNIRKFISIILNKTLRLINKKNGAVCHLFAFFIKRKIKIRGNHDTR